MKPIRKYILFVFYEISSILDDLDYTEINHTWCGDIFLLKYHNNHFDGEVAFYGTHVYVLDYDFNYMGERTDYYFISII